VSAGASCGLAKQSYTKLTHSSSAGSIADNKVALHCSMTLLDTILAANKNKICTGQQKLTAVRSMRSRKIASREMLGRADIVCSRQLATKTTPKKPPQHRKAPLLGKQSFQAYICMHLVPTGSSLNPTSAHHVQAAENATTCT